MMAFCVDFINSGYPSVMPKPAMKNGLNEGREIIGPNKCEDAVERSHWFHSVDLCHREERKV